jgi:hypothetical protein
MPVPSVDPIPPRPAFRTFATLLAHDASYFAASARIDTFSPNSMYPKICRSTGTGK